MSVMLCVSLYPLLSQFVFAEEESDSDEDSEDDDWDDNGDYDSGTEDGGVHLDDSVCPPGTKILHRLTVSKAVELRFWFWRLQGTFRASLLASAKSMTLYVGLRL